MPKPRKGQAVARSDLLALAGGLDCVVKSFLFCEILQQDTSSKSAVWSSLAQNIFHRDTLKNRKWLYVLWTFNRRNIRRLIEEQSQKESSCKAEESIDNYTENVNTVSNVSQKVKSTESVQPDLRDKKTLEMDIKSNAEQPARQITNNRTGEKGLHKSDETVSQNPDFEATDWAESETETKSDTKQPTIRFRSGQKEDTKSDENESEDSHAESKDSHHDIPDSTKGESYDSEHETLFQKYTENSEKSYVPKTETAKIKVLRMEHEAKIYTERKVSESPTSSGSSKSASNEIIKYRKVPCTPVKFIIVISPKDWKKIAPMKDSTTLQKSWTNILYQHFRQKNPCCALNFTYQHVRCVGSRKRHVPYLKVKAVCKFSTCNARYTFIMSKKPNRLCSSIKMTVRRTGSICHLRKETRLRPASNIRRGKIARIISQGVSEVYYKKLRSTPVQELISGNLTQSLNKNILKVIAAEVKKNMQVHENVLMEMYLTQRIIKVCDSNFHDMPGYIQHFQVNPFSAHLYTEVGLSILVHHLREKKPVSLYLDATGGVVSKIPEQSKRVLYYAVTLPGGGRDAPPLPVCEMLSNEHSIPPLAFWLMQFHLKLSKYTRHKVQKVETDYSWALMQAVVLAFNRQSIDAYLEWTYAVHMKIKTWAEIKGISILHLCSAHIIKAVSVSIGKKTGDKGLKEFCTFVFARLQNTVNVGTASEIFRHFCVLLLASHESATVSNSRQYLDGLIRHKKAAIDDITDEKYIDMWENEEERRSAKTIVGRSPYSRLFKKVFEEVKHTVDSEKGEHNRNAYYCPEVPIVLMDNYMGIYPLWSGALLGDLRKHASDKENTGHTSDSAKTRDTNCHAETWFGIVKHSILHKERKFRPAEFIQRMYASLNGRYREHIINHSLPDNLLVCPIRPKKSVAFAEESWAKREEPAPKKAEQSKYYSVPKKEPKPKTKAMPSKKDETTDSNLPKQQNFCDMTVSKQVEFLWTCPETEMVVSVFKSTYTLRHADFTTLMPHKLLNGEAMECYMWAVLQKQNKNGRLFLLNHYVTGVILHGTRQQMARQALSNVNFESYDGAISFVNINSNHWQFVYLHTLSGQTFVVDPMTDDLEHSRQAAQKFQEYFKMRRNRLGKEEWTRIKWQPCSITHTLQKDATSCGVFVMEMAKQTIAQFPEIPDAFHINPSKTAVSKLREEMAALLLSASDSKNDFCGLCGQKELPQRNKTSDAVINWTQCDSCEHWFHNICLPSPMSNLTESPWHCVLCAEREHGP